MSQQLDQTIARAEAILAQCMVAANQAAAAAASIGAAGLAPLESPLFTGNPRAPTPASNDASQSIATTAWIGAKLAQPSGIATLDVDGIIPLDQLPFAGLTAKGTWNAFTNTPTLSAGTAGNTNGDFYIVTVAGSTNLSGITTWNTGDWALFSANVWTRVPYSAPPLSNIALSSLAGQADKTVVGNTSGGSASPTAITIASLMAYMGVVTTGGSGLCPTLPGGTGTFLRGDGNWQAIAAPDLSAYALLNSPAFLGTATVATQARTTMSSAIASTQFIFNQLAGTGEVGFIAMNGIAAAGTAPYLTRIDHVHATDTSRAAATNPTLTGSAIVLSGTATIGPRQTLSGTTTFSGTVNGTFTSTVSGTHTVNGTVVVNGTLTLNGTVTGAPTFSGQPTFAAGLVCAGTAVITSVNTLSFVGAPVVESNITLADNATNNSSTGAHGFLKKLDNVATNFMNGQGNWAAPSTGQPIPSTSALPVGSVIELAFVGVQSLANNGTTGGANISLSVINNAGNLVDSSVTQSGTWKNISGVTLGSSNNQAGRVVRTA